MPKRPPKDMPQPHADSPTLEEPKPTALVAVPRIHNERTLSESDVLKGVRCPVDGNVIAKGDRCCIVCGTEAAE